LDYSFNTNDTMDGGTMMGRFCGECYKKNFMLTRPCTKVYSDYHKIIWECPECRKEYEQIWREYDD